MIRLGPGRMQNDQLGILQIDQKRTSIIVLSRSAVPLSSDSQLSGKV